jgi:hypothetical protein
MELRPVLNDYQLSQIQQGYSVYNLKLYLVFDNVEEATIAIEALRFIMEHPEISDIVEDYNNKSVESVVK